MLSFAVVIPAQRYLSRLRLASKFAVSKIALAVESGSSQSCAQKQQAHNTKIAAASSLWTFVYASCKLSLKGVFTVAKSDILECGSMSSSKGSISRKGSREGSREDSRVGSSKGSRKGSINKQKKRASEKGIRTGH